MHTITPESGVWLLISIQPLPFYDQFVAILHLLLQSLVVPQEFSVVIDLFM